MPSTGSNCCNDLAHITPGLECSFSSYGAPQLTALVKTPCTLPRGDYIGMKTLLPDVLIGEGTRCEADVISYLTFAHAAMH